MKERCWKVVSRKARKGTKVECFLPIENNQGSNKTSLETGNIQISIVFRTG